MSKKPDPKKGKTSGVALFVAFCLAVSGAVYFTGNGDAVLAQVRAMLGL
ncbi:MAG: hypothetical protein WAT39_09855 [Planctomycetota bacterium]